MSPRTRRVGFVIDFPPGETLKLREELDLVLAALALEQQVSVFFREDGVYHCLPVDEPPRPDPAALIGSLPLYDPALIAVDADALARRGLDGCKLRWPFERLGARSIDDRLRAQEILL